jgi:CheY-like chemotaxis protein
VVIVSADASPGQTQRLLAAGAQEFMPKPLDVRKLLDVVDAALTVKERPPTG